MQVNSVAPRWPIITAFMCAKASIPLVWWIYCLQKIITDCSNLWKFAKIKKNKSIISISRVYLVIAEKITALFHSEKQRIFYVSVKKVENHHLKYHLNKSPLESRLIAFQINIDSIRNWKSVPAGQSGNNKTARDNDYSIYQIDYAFSLVGERYGCGLFNCYAFNNKSSHIKTATVLCWMGSRVRYSHCVCFMCQERSE